MIKKEEKRKIYWKIYILEDIYRKKKGRYIVDQFGICFLCASLMKHSEETDTAKPKVRVRNSLC